EREQHDGNRHLPDRHHVLPSSKAAPRSSRRITEVTVIDVSVSSVRLRALRGCAFDRSSFPRLSTADGRPLDMQPFGCIFCPSRMNKVFKALADGSRRQLLDQLHANNGQTLSELCAHLDMTRQAVTKHLRLLEAANLVVAVRRGREKLHYLNPVPLHDIAERWIGKFERQRLRAL